MLKATTSANHKLGLTFLTKLLDINDLQCTLCVLLLSCYVHRATLGKICIKLVIVTGLTWIADVISWAHGAWFGGTYYIWIVTDLINTLQGKFSFTCNLFSPYLPFSFLSIPSQGAFAFLVHSFVYYWDIIIMQHFLGVFIFCVIGCQPQVISSLVIN